MTKCLKKFGDLYSGQYFMNLDDSYFIKLSAVIGVDGSPNEISANAVDFNTGDLWYFEDIAPVYVLDKDEPRPPF
jgi:hypothetical protein